MHVLDGIDQLQHKVTDIVRLFGATARADSLIKITHSAVLESEINVRISFERSDEIDNIRVRAQHLVRCELLRAVINKYARAWRRNSRWLGHALDSNIVAVNKIPGESNHAKGTVIDRGKKLEAVVENNTVPPF